MSAAPKQPHVVNLVIKDKQALYSAYMPFIANGGLFVPAKEPYPLGEEVLMLVDLMNGQEKLAVAGTVVWVTPRGASGQRISGVGVQFSADNKGSALRKIETLLAGFQNTRRTPTM
ncbi:MAG: type IV pilus assembly protein PilZ [Gammaproteobacteria bacterium]|jgi:type IV pilus assembly protein PilZ